MPNFFQRSVEKKKKQVGLATQKTLHCQMKTPKKNQWF
jgi:hypothetical protein